MNCELTWQQKGRENLELNKFKHATYQKNKTTYCDGEIDGLTSPSMSAYRRHYQTQLRRRFFLFDKQQDCREPTLEREEEECKEEAVLSKKKQPEIWGFSQAMPGMRYLYIKDCESSFSCLIPRILTLSFVTCRKES